MKLKNAMAAYFAKLEKVYQKNFGTLPTVSWDDSMNADLLIGSPDEDGEIQWRAKPAGILLQIPGLCAELEEFYGSYYFLEMRGEYKNTVFDFYATSSYEASRRVAANGMANGQYYFKNQDVVLLATCCSPDNDDLILFYRQSSGKLFMYDSDKRFIHPMEISLADLIGSMEAVI